MGDLVPKHTGRETPARNDSLGVRLALPLGTSQCYQGALVMSKQESMAAGSCGQLRASGALP